MCQQRCRGCSPAWRTCAGDRHADVRQDRRLTARPSWNRTPGRSVKRLSRSVAEQGERSSPDRRYGSFRTMRLLPAERMRSQITVGGDDGSRSRPAKRTRSRAGDCPRRACRWWQAGRPFRRRGGSIAAARDRDICGRSSLHALPWPARGRACGRRHDPVSLASRLLRPADGEALRAPALRPVACWSVEQRDGKIFVRGKQAQPKPKPVGKPPAKRPRES